MEASSCARFSNLTVLLLLLLPFDECCAVSSPISPVLELHACAPRQPSQAIQLVAVSSACSCPQQQQQECLYRVSLSSPRPSSAILWYSLPPSVGTTPLSTSLYHTAVHLPICTPTPSRCAQCVVEPIPPTPLPVIPPDISRSLPRQRAEARPPASPPKTPISHYLCHLDLKTESRCSPLAPSLSTDVIISTL